MRYFIELAYNGKSFHGWQYQPNAVTIQETLEKALTLLLQSKIELVGAGRTDAGVHASFYIAHFDTNAVFDEIQLCYKLNSFLSNDIAVFAVKKVKEDAHARFTAISRSYKYYIIQQKDPFLYETAHYVKNELDLDLMNEAALELKNYEDFKCFSRSKTDVKTYNCKIENASWKIVNNTLIFHITADRFLRNMVRAIVGTLLEVGAKKINIEDFKKIIESRDRGQAGTSVPAKALFLTQIEYPTSIFIK